MKLNIIKKLVLTAFIGGAMLAPSVTQAGDRYHRDDRGDRYEHHNGKGHFDLSVAFGQFGYTPYAPPACERVWVEPVYRTECQRVWVAPVYRTECGRVWIEPVYGCRQVVVWECGRRVIRNERVLVSAGYWQTTSQQVLVTAGYWTTQETQVLVSAGYWETRSAPVSSAFVFSFGR